MAPRPRSRSLRRLLRRLTLHLKLQAALRGLEYYVAGAAAFIGCAAAADLAFELSSGPRAKVLAVFAVASFLWFTLGLALPFVRRINPLYAAKLVEEAVPDCESALVTLVEDESGALDEGVADLLEERLEAVLAGVDGRLCAPPADLAGVHRLLSIVMVVGVFVALAGGAGFYNSLVRVLFPGSSGPGRPVPEFAEIIPGEVKLREGESLHVRAGVAGMVPRRLLVRFTPEGGEPVASDLARGVGRTWSGSLGPVERPGRYVVIAESRRPGDPNLFSRSFAVRVRRFPRLDDLKVTYTYPAYSGLAPRTVAEPRVDCLEGTRVRVEFAPSAELSRASARLEPGGEVRLSQSPGGRLGFEFDARVSGRWTVRLISSGGLERSFGPYPVIARADAAPEAIAIAETPPGGRIGDRGVGVSVRASDDYGLARVELLLSRPGRKPRSFAVPSVGRRRSFFARMRIPRDAFASEETGDAGAGSASGGAAASGIFRYRLKVTDNRRPTANVTLSRERSIDLVASAPSEGLFEPQPRRLKRKRSGDSSATAPREVEMAQRDEGTGRDVERLGGEPEAGDGTPPSPPPREGERSDYTGLTGEAPPDETAKESPEGEPGREEKRRPEEGGDTEGGGEGERPGEGEGGGAEERRGPPGEPGEGPTGGGGELPVPPDSTAGGEGGTGPPPTKVGRESIGARGARTEVPETVDERRVDELEFADDEVARLAGENMGARTGFGAPGDPGGGGGGTGSRGGGETSVGRAGAENEGAPVTTLTEGPVDPRAPTGAVAVDLSKKVDPEYRPLVSEYFRRLAGGR